jgi:hypothetical protein
MDGLRSRRTVDRECREAVQSRATRTAASVVEDSEGRDRVLNCSDGLGRSSGSGRAYPSAHAPDWRSEGGRCKWDCEV